MVGSRPRRSFAAAQSASNSSASISCRVVWTISPPMGSRVSFPNHMPPKDRDRWSSRALSVVVGFLFRAVGVDDAFPAVAVRLEGDEPDRPGRLHQEVVVAFEGLLRPRGADLQHGGDVRPVDLTIGPRLLDQRQVTYRPRVAEPLPGHADRDALLPRQPGGRGLRTRRAPLTQRVPPRQHPRLRHIQRTPQLLQPQHRLGQIVTDHHVEIERRQRIQCVRGGIEDGGRGSWRLLIGSGHVDPPSGRAHDPKPIGSAAGLRIVGDPEVPKGKNHRLSNWCTLRGPPSGLRQQAPTPPAKPSGRSGQTRRP